MASAQLLRSTRVSYKLIYICSPCARSKDDVSVHKLKTCPNKTDNLWICHCTGQIPESEQCPIFGPFFFLMSYVPIRMKKREKSHRAPSTPVCMGGICYYASLLIWKLRFCLLHCLILISCPIKNTTSAVYCRDLTVQYLPAHSLCLAYFIIIQNSNGFLSQSSILTFSIFIFASVLLGSSTLQASLQSTPSASPSACCRIHPGSHLPSGN